MVETFILDETKTVVYSERALQYGLPENNFAAIARLWEAYRNGSSAPINANDVAIMLILMKVGRSTSGHYKHDTAVDLAGYAECYARINEVGGK